MSVKKFDLNIERILEDWELYHAIREIIANALDEQMLTQTKDIEIFKDDEDRWHIRDYGRGLKYEHLTQNENDEKLRNPNVIGKFGIGLKDALATFERKGVDVFIKSKYGDITIEKSQKHGFDDIITLHACISPPSEPEFIGTDFILTGVNDKDITKSMNLFLKFSGERILEKTKYGEILEKKGKRGKIYINGVKVSEEENFLFSYNITSLTKKIKKALNRERTNVGRNAYSDRIKKIILQCSSKTVAEKLAEDLKNYSTGNIHDELHWLDVQKHAVKILNSLDKVIFLTHDDLIHATNMVDEAKSSGYKIITIPENLKSKINGLKDVSGNAIRDLEQFMEEYNESFEYKFVELNELSPKEMEIFKTTDGIFKLIGGKPKNVREIKISETMKKEGLCFTEAAGVWEPLFGRIIIKRTQLKSLELYANTLLHEAAHATSGASDVSREFELELSRFLGLIASKALNDIK